MKKSKISKSFAWIVLFTILVYAFAGFATGVYANKLNPGFAGFNAYYNHAIIDSLIYPMKVGKNLIVGLFTLDLYKSIYASFVENPAVGLYNSFTFLVFFLVALVFGITAIVIIVKTFTHRKPSLLWNILFGVAACFFLTYALCILHTLLYGTASTNLFTLDVTKGAIYSYWTHKGAIIHYDGWGTNFLGGIKRWVMAITLVLAIIALVVAFVFGLIYLIQTNIYVSEHKYDYLAKRENKAKAKYYKEHGFQNGVAQQAQQGKKSKKQLKAEARAAKAYAGDPYAYNQNQQPYGPQPAPYAYPYGYPYPPVMPVQQNAPQPQVIVPPSGGNNVSTGNNAPLIVQYITNGEKATPVSQAYDPNQAGIYGVREARASQASLTKDDLKSAVLEVLRENDLLGRPQIVQAQQVTPANQPAVQPVVAPVIAPNVAAKPVEQETTIVLDDNGKREEFDVLTVDDLVDLIKETVGETKEVVKEETKNEVYQEVDEEDIVSLEDIQKIIADTVDSRFEAFEASQAKVHEAEVAAANEVIEQTKVCDSACGCEEEEVKVEPAKEAKREEKVIPPIVVAIPSKIEPEKVEEEPQEEIYVAPVQEEEEEERINEDDLRNLIREELKDALSSIKVETKETIKEVPVYVHAPEPVVKEVIKEVPVVKEVVAPAPVQEVKVEEPVVVRQPISRGKENSVEKGEAVKLTFAQKVLASSSDILVAYNSLKNLLLSYGLKDRLSTSGDTFRLKRKTYCKIAMGGHHLKIYLALDPKDYKNKDIAVGDAGFKDQYADIPLVFRVKSDASLEKARDLVKDCMAKGEIAQVAEEGKIDHVPELKAAK